MSNVYGVFRREGLTDADRYATKVMSDTDGTWIESETAIVAIEGPFSPGFFAWSEHVSGHAGVFGAPPRAVRPANAGDMLGEVIKGDFKNIEKLQRNFAGWSVNEQHHTLRLFVDPYGLEPLHYLTDGQVVFFSTRLFPLLRSGHCDTIDPQAINELFTFGHCVGHRTMLTGVELIPPGECLFFGANGPRLAPWTRLRLEDVASENPIRPEKVAGLLHEHLDSAVHRSVGSTERIGITLSGGLDSRALLGCLSRMDRDVEAFTFGDEECFDAKYAAQMCKIVHTPHTLVPSDGGFLVTWLGHAIDTTGGMVSADHFHILILHQIISSRVDLVLDGLGGDALTGAHLSLRMTKATRPEYAAEQLYRKRAAYWANPIDRVLLINGLEDAHADQPRRVMLEYARRDPERPWWGCHMFDLLERQRRLVQYGPHLFRPLIDVQTPFYDPDLIAVLMAAPLSMLRVQRAYFQTHRRYWPELARVPDATRGLPVDWPASVRFGKRVADAAWRRIARRVPALWRPSRTSPTDYSAWFRGALLRLLREYILDPHPVFHDLIDRNTIERLVKAHVEGRENQAGRLACLMTMRSVAEHVVTARQAIRQASASTCQAERNGPIGLRG